MCSCCSILYLFKCCVWWNSKYHLCHFLLIPRYCSHRIAPVEVCVCVCVCVCVSVCLWVCACMCLCVCVCVHVCVCEWVCMWVSDCVCVCECVCLWVCMWVNEWLCMWASVSVCGGYQRGKGGSRVSTDMKLLLVVCSYAHKWWLTTVQQDVCMLGLVDLAQWLSVTDMQRYNQLVLVN